MMNQWRLICMARHAEMDLVAAYTRNHHLNEVIDSTNKESDLIRYTIGQKLASLEALTKHLADIHQSWVPTIRLDVIFRMLTFRQSNCLMSY
jgi:hypothetical protein